jgi:hypothetical protein
MAQRPHQENLDLDSYESYPEWSRDIFFTPDQLKSKPSKLLASMRELRLKEKAGQINNGESYKTYAEMAELLFPTFPRTAKNNQSEFSGFEYEEYQQLKRDKNKNTTSSLVRTIKSILRKHLEGFDNENQRITFLKKHGELIVPIEKTASGSYYFVYLSPDLPLSSEESQAYWELTLEHSALQDQNQKIAGYYYRSGFQQLGLILNPESFDTPDQEMDNLGNL